MKTELSSWINEKGLKAIFGLCSLYFQGPLLLTLAAEV